MGPECWPIDWIQSKLWDKKKIFLLNYITRNDSLSVSVTYIRESITVIFHGHILVRQQWLQVLDGFLVVSNSSFRITFELLDFIFHLAFLGDNLRCLIVWWIWNFDGFVIFLECVDQSRNGHTRLVVSPIDFRSRFRVGSNTRMIRALSMNIHSTSIPNQITSSSIYHFSTWTGWSWDVVLVVHVQPMHSS